MVSRIARDYDLSWADVLAQTMPGSTVGRPHIAGRRARREGIGAGLDGRVPDDSELAGRLFPAAQGAIARGRGRTHRGSRRGASHRASGRPRALDAL